MKKTFAILTLSSQIIFAQNISQKLDEATKKLMNSSTAVSSNLSFYVSDEGGNLVYEFQGNKDFQLHLHRKFSLLLQL